MTKISSNDNEVASAASAGGGLRQSGQTGQVICCFSERPPGGLQKLRAGEGWGVASASNCGPGLQMSVVLRVGRGWMWVVVAGFTRRPGLHHGCRGRMLTVHHISHSGRVGAWIPTWASSIGLVNHWLDYASPCIDEPVVDLEDCETSVLGQLFLLVLWGVRVR